MADRTGKARWMECFILVQLRKQYPIIQEGSIAFLYQNQMEIFGYKRSFENQELLVINNLTDAEVLRQEPVLCREYEYLIRNYPQKVSEDTLETLRPYESIVLYKNR